MKWWTIGLNLWVLLDRLNFAEWTDCSGNIEMISHDADCFQGSQSWCEPFDGHTMRKITFWSLSRFLKRLSFWLELRGVFRFGFRWAVPLPSIEILGFDLRIQFSLAFHYKKFQEKCGTCWKILTNFPLLFRNFPPTSSSPLLQIHLAKNQQQKRLPGEWCKSRKLIKTQDFGF